MKTIIQDIKGVLRVILKIIVVIVTIWLLLIILEIVALRINARIALIQKNAKTIQEKPPTSTISRDSILNSINTYRVNGLHVNSVEFDDCLQDIADKRLKEVQIDYNHDTSQMSSWFKECPEMEEVAENLNNGTETDNDLILSWLNSYNHKDILDGDYNKIGIALVDDPYVFNDSYVVTIFGKSNSK